MELWEEGGLLIYLEICTWKSINAPIAHFAIHAGNLASAKLEIQGNIWWGNSKEIIQRKAGK